MATQQDIRWLYRAMRNADTLVVELQYTDAVGQRSLRKVSPIRRTGPGLVLVLCLSSGEPRQLKLDRICNVRIVRADSVLCPEPKCNLGTDASAVTNRKESE